MKEVKASTLEALRSNDGFKSKNHGKLSLGWPVRVSWKNTQHEETKVSNIKKF